MEKLLWCDYLMVKKFDDMFSSFDTIPACDGQISCDMVSALCVHRAINKKLRCCRETARNFVPLNISLSYSRSLKII